MKPRPEHLNAPLDEDDAPEITEAWLAGAIWMVDGKPTTREHAMQVHGAALASAKALSRADGAVAGAVAAVRKPGRPPSPSPKIATKLRLDADVLARFRADGPGWQSRINAVLREWCEAHK